MKVLLKNIIKKATKFYETITTKTFHYSKLNQKNLTSCKRQIVKINFNNNCYYFYISIHDISKPFIVFSNAAYNIMQSTPPFFMRKTWRSSLKYNCIFIDDLTVHDNELNVGWGIGDESNHYLKDYATIIMHIMSLLNKRSEDVYYFGSSAGGFMSMLLATYHKGASAIVNNPQTDVFRYYPTPVNKMCKTLFSTEQRSDVYEKYVERFSVIENIKTYNHTPHVYLLQNELSSNDMKMHIQPFIAELNGIKDFANIHFILYRRQHDGHNSLSKEHTINIINMIIDGRLNDISKYIQDNVDDKD